MTMRRIQMKPDALPEPIISPSGQNLGTFLPGLGYWITTENHVSVEKVLADGRAVEVDPQTAPLPPGVQLDVTSGQITGLVKTGN